MSLKAIALGAVTLLAVGALAGALLVGNDTDASAPSATTPSSPYLPGISLGSPSTASASAVTFGEAQELRDGITAAASEPQSWRPSSMAAGTEGAARFVRVDVTLTNKTSRFVNFSEQFYPNIRIDGARTNSVIEFSNNANVGGLPNKAVAPGASATFSMAWALPSQNAALSLELTPSGTGGGGRAVTWSGDA